MSEKVRKKSSKDRIDKTRKKEKSHKTSESSPIEEDGTSAKSALALLSDDARIDPTLSSLFSAKPTPVVRKPQTLHKAVEEDEVDGEEDVTVPGLAIPTPHQGDGRMQHESTQGPHELDADRSIKRKRRRTDAEDEIEDVYMRRIAREEAKEAEAVAVERAKKRQKTLKSTNGGVDGAVSEEEDDNGASEHESNERQQDDGVEDDMSPPPRHETEQAPDVEREKVNRTVFLGNVSTKAIASKAARKELIDHLKSFFKDLPKSKTAGIKHKIESIRFRSTPYATAVPKKASFARREVMDATTKSTNAYVVFSSPLLAREAVKHLNATIILDRHLRVDSVAHPAPTDHKRCIFIGGLSFVDDETNIQSANSEDNNEKKRNKKPKQPADVEEGLWRTFSKCGNVESVRVIRDSNTRVGKGIAYVQFEDGNAVEAALLYDGKKFPPMLPRTLRVSRAKSVKRNKQRASQDVNGVRRKGTGREKSKMGRLKEREADRGERKPQDRQRQPLANGVKRPETFVFEGHRATSKSGKSGLKLDKKKGGKPTNRSASFKAGKKK